MFERLNLHFLRPQAIVEILKGTHLGEKTLFSHYELDDNQAEKVAAHLYSQTAGHPRSLLQAFRSCPTCDELLRYTRPYTVENYKEFNKVFHKHISIYNFVQGRNKIHFR